MGVGRETSRELLDAAYANLGFADGDLFDASEQPVASNKSAWVEKGEWLALGKKVGAERVFFVDNNPVVVFATQDELDPGRWLRFFNRVWCMARPQLLFLAREGELSVYNLTKVAAREKGEPSRNERLLEIVQKAADVQVKLQKYRRDRIESGSLFFEDERFGFNNRADHALIRDLKIVRAALIETGLSVPYAHALIGRSIFVRYLEDREVLTEQYFRNVAAGNKTWTDILHTVPPDAYLPEDERPIYPRVLSNKDFTYKLFRQLAVDFNGDMFPIDKDEEPEVADVHLSLLQSFLLGRADEPMFFFAYRFNIIPIELISSIYEEFYSVEQGKSEHQGSFYTPSSLVEFVLSQTLNESVLNSRPRIIDPACGSGIFLVESFRRLVRHRVKELGRRLRPNELQKILRDQIAGIDINPEAIRVAAFSLYLALLHYQEPRDILKRKLPGLAYSKRESTDPAIHFDILLAANAFRVADKVAEESIRKGFGSECADIVVGNPPWGDLSGRDPLSIDSRKGAMEWCREGDRSVGDKELSQAFIHKTLDLLKDGGRAGLLVSTGVFFKRHEPSRVFRGQWLNASVLEQVFNFAAVRDTFFSGPTHKEGSIAPFASVVFTKRIPRVNDHFAYWSAKKTAFIERAQSVVMNRADLRIVRQANVLEDDDLWKVYWWGGHRDKALLDGLRLEKTLVEFIDPEGIHLERIGRGYQPTGSPMVPSEWLTRYRELPTRRYFERYGPLPAEEVFERVPRRVFRRGVQEVYEGTRLLVKRGITEKENANGLIVARLESEPFCFRDSIHGIRLLDRAQEEAKVLLGIIWSSLVRYYLFITSGTWGMWHHEIKRETIERIPIRIPTDPILRERIVGIVDKLRDFNPLHHSLFTPHGLTKLEIQRTIVDLESQLDEAIFDLYQLSEDEKDLVRDMCTIGLDLLYRGMKSEAFQPVNFVNSSSFGRHSDVIAKRGSHAGLEGYVDAFLDVWEPELYGTEIRLIWRVIRPDVNSPMLVVVFSTETEDEPLPSPPEPESNGRWQVVMEKMSVASIQPLNTRRIYVDGITRVVTETDIVLIKRNERRLWTRSAAREDAEATLSQLIRKQLARRNLEVTRAPT
jgi:hypothetical protein